MPKIIFLYLTLLCALSITLALCRTVDYSQGDAHGSLITSQLIWQHKTLSWEPLCGSTYDCRMQFGHTIKGANGKAFYLFPIGTAIVSIPISWLGYQMGYDCFKIANGMSAADIALQQWMIPLTVCITAVLLFLIGLNFVSPLLSFLFTGAIVFGSPLISVNGTALWSTNWQVVFITAVFYIITKSKNSELSSNQLMRIALLLFIGYLCRPTTLLLIPLIGIFIVFPRNGINGFAKFGLFTGVSFSIFLFACQQTYGQWVPDYYQLGRISAKSSQYLEALYGNTFGPARGLFIYAPITAIILFVSVRTLFITKNAIVLMAFTWFILHLIAIAGFNPWYGGESFGPRLQTELMPAFAVLGFLVIQDIRQYQSKWVRYFWIGIFVITAFFGIWANTYQGLFNPAIKTWNAQNTKYKNWHAINDWQSPLIFTNQKKVDLREEMLFCRKN